ncbi:MAG: hypothetical protein Q9180_008030, partial [Flavoplaca navasiana]
PHKPNTNAQNPPSIRAWIRSLAAEIPWLRPYLPTPATQNTTFTSLITYSSTSLTSVKNYSIHLYRNHILSYYSSTLSYCSRTTRYLAAVRAYEAELQLSRLTQNQTSQSPSTAISLKLTRQETIQEIAGFQPGEVVPYPALWVEPWVRGYERGLEGFDGGDAGFVLETEDGDVWYFVPFGLLVDQVATWGAGAGD